MVLPLDRDLQATWEDVQGKLALLPPLEHTLRLPPGPALHARLVVREAWLGVATLSADCLYLFVHCFREAGLDIAAQLLRHAATLHAYEKQALLPRGVHVQKTITLAVKGRLVLVTSVGDRHLERAERIALADHLGISHKAILHHATINSPEINVERELGLLRGMVSPFLPPGRGAGLAALVQLAWPARWEHTGQRVAVSLSPFESLLIPLSAYSRILAGYVRWSGLPLLSLT